MIQGIEAAPSVAITSGKTGRELSLWLSVLGCISST